MDDEANAGMRLLHFSELECTLSTFVSASEDDDANKYDDDAEVATISSSISIGHLVLAW